MFHDLRILVWKHMKERVRRLSTLFWEIFCGVLLFACLLLLRFLLNEIIAKETIFVGNTSVLENATVLYWPNDANTKMFVNQVTASLKSNRNYDKQNNMTQNLDGNITLNNFTGNELFHGFKNEEDLKIYLQKLKTQHPVLFVHFMNENVQGYLEHLNYSIGIVEEAANEIKLESMYFNKFSTDNVIAIAELQWTIDKTFLEILANEKLNQIIYIDIIRILPLEAKLMHSFLILCTVIAPLPYFLSMSKKIVIEKRSGLLELIKLVGVKPSTLHASHLMESAFYGLVYAILASIALKVTSTPVLPGSNYFILCVTIFLHLLSVTSMSFVTSTLSQDYQHSDSAALLFYMMIFLTVSVWHKTNVSTTSVYIVCVFLPHSPLFIFWDQIIYLENVGTGAGFVNIFRKHDSRSSPIILIWLFFIIQIILIMFLAWYLILIRPGRYGVAAKWNFFFERSFWKKQKKVNFHATVEKSKDILRDDRFFEPRPRNSVVAIRIVNLTKVFRGEGRKREVVALQKICLDVTKGSITVLLGGNGAGKTTLMSVIAGMHTKTEGRVYVNGYDISTRFKEIRRDLGFCPQVNLIFDYLTVRENLIFFGKLKNLASGLEEDADSIIHRFNMQEWADLYSYQLSCGMKRCLQVAVALVGDTDVLVLDEPTSTMDAGMRHALWECLLGLRGVKTIFMSTTLMEEADALGDRIALLHNGKLKCDGSPQFLKNAMGSETRLTVTVKYGEDTQKVQDIISQMIPNAGIIRQEDDRLHFRLDSEQKQLIKLLDTLEQQKKELNISNMEIGMSLEYVFLRFLSGEEDLNESCDAASIKRIEDFRIERWSLWIQQIRVLMKRIFLYYLTKKYQFFFMQVFLPLVGLMLVTLGTNEDFFSYNQLTLQDLNDDNIVLINNRGHFRKTNIFEEIKMYYPRLDIVDTTHVFSDLQKQIKLHTNHLPRNVVGLSWERNHSVIMYPMADLTSLSRDINLYSNIYKSLHLPFAKNHKLITNYVPVSDGLNSNQKVIRPKTIINTMIWSITTSFFVTVPLAPLILMVIEEYNNSVRYCQVVAGCSPLIIWMAKLLAHMIIYLCVVPLTVLITAYLLDSDHTLDQPHFLAAVFIVLLLFGPAFLVHMYVLSFFLEMDHAISQLYICTLCVALISPTAIILLGPLSLVWSNILFWAGQIFPSLNLSTCISELAITARTNSYCNLNRALCPKLPVSGILFPAKFVAICCASNDKSPFGYFVDSNTPGILFHLMIFIFQIIVYSVLLILLQDRRAQNWWGKLFNWRYKKPGKHFTDTQVKDEEKYVFNKMEALNKKSLAEKKEILGNDVLLVRDIHKVYSAGCFKKRCHAVRGLTFSLKKGECLGILGPNGAGKTTTLGMVTGRTCMTRGNAMVSGYFIRENRRMYLHKLAFMRAVFGLDAFLSGFDNLVLISMLYGRPRMLAEKYALQWMQFMGLSPLCDVLTERYSMGCSRRLSVCSALIICPRVAMFDEPTSSVDAHTRPLVARAVHYALEAGTACVVAEGSMSWRHMDSVCNRIGLLIRGQFAAIDSAQEFRQNHAAGYTVIFKLAVDSAIHVIPQSPSVTSLTTEKDLSFGTEMDLFKQDFLSKFENSSLLDEHLNLLHYHIREGKTYSQMYVYLEEMKSKYECIENYTLSETSIEEVYCKLQNKHMTLGIGLMPLKS